MLSYSKGFSIDLAGVIAKSCIISKVLSLTPHRIKIITQYMVIFQWLKPLNNHTTSSSIMQHTTLLGYKPMHHFR